MSQIKKIAILTSGGDAPGMNAAIRAVVRGAIYHGLEVMGCQRGFQGLIENRLVAMNSKSVSNIIQRGGTSLESARSEAFRSSEGRSQAYQHLRAHGVDALVVIGGDGSFTGASLLAAEHDFPVVGIPGTIDNDLDGTDHTIGYDTALNTVVEAVDKIRDTASSHRRLFFIEVMGRDAGFLALHSGIACGAEAILVPEVENKYQGLDTYLGGQRIKDKSSSIVLVAEGERCGGALKAAEWVAREHPEYDVRVSILGHIQRGGSPSAVDRVLASRLGVAAVEALLAGQRDIMLGVLNHVVVQVPFEQAIKHKKPLQADLLGLIEVLSI
jgi:6-phosphofructokinase 1